MAPTLQKSCDAYTSQAFHQYLACNKYSYIIQQAIAITSLAWHRDLRCSRGTWGSNLIPEAQQAITVVSILCFYCDGYLPSYYFLPDGIWAFTPVCLLLCLSLSLSLLRAWRHSYLQLLRLIFQVLVILSRVDFAYVKLQVIKIKVVEPRIYLKCLRTLRNIWSAHLKLELKNKPRCTRQPKTKTYQRKSWDENSRRLNIVMVLLCVPPPTQGSYRLTET